MCTFLFSLFPLLKFPCSSEIWTPKRENLISDVYFLIHNFLTRPNRDSQSPTGRSWVRVPVPNSWIVLIFLWFFLIPNYFFQLKKLIWLENQTSSSWLKVHFSSQVSWFSRSASFQPLSSLFFDFCWIDKNKGKEIIMVIVLLGIIEENQIQKLNFIQLLK